VRTVSHWIGGKPATGTSTRTAPVWDPATGQQQAEVLLAGAADVDTAVRSAKAAFATWGQSSLAQRTKVLFAFRELVNARMDDLAALISDEHGKVLSDARGEVQRGLEVVEFACGLPSLLKGDFSDQVSGGVDVHSFRQPLGVCVGITPFNFPAMVPMWMHPVAIACGNTFVLKPSERDPSASNLVAAWRAMGVGRPSAPMRAGSHTASVTAARPFRDGGGCTVSVSTPVTDVAAAEPCVYQA